MSHIFSEDKPKFLIDKLEENTNPDGDILCISCEVGYLTHEKRKVEVSYVHKEKKVVDLLAYHCDVCNDTIIGDKEAKIIRKSLA